MSLRILIEDEEFKLAYSEFQIYADDNSIPLEYEDDWNS